MNKLVQELIAGIERDEEEAFLGAGEVAAAVRFGHEAHPAIEPYQQRLVTDPPDPEDMQALLDSLVQHIQSASAPAGAAAFALGKFHEPSLVPLLREQLERHLRTLLECTAAVSNLICALENSGEKIISPGDHSLTEPGKIIDDARNYLLKQGLKIPW